ncbi:MAG: hypothetical protein JXX14_06170 [Deltaproteobacteria bacterium]|nr:hypothetical protein [Deltaproteobacteria bacterium]
MKKTLLLLSGLLAIGAVLSIGCMDREPAPVCPVPTELKKSDPGVSAYDGVDILVVVDNSASMSQEQEILATSFFPLVNSLVNPIPGWEFDANSNIRIAITTSDMGVQYDGKEYDDKDGKFDNPQVKCVGMGDDGEFRTDYVSGATSVNIREGVIDCGEEATQCPAGWTCENLNDAGVGKCMDPNGNGEGVDCPASPDDRNAQFIDEDRDDKALAVACLAQVGIDGCNYEQQLVAAAKGLENTITDVGKSDFLRSRSLTTILIVSDEEDCSLKSNKWHDLKELTNVDANLACGLHSDLLFDISELKDRFDEAKEAGTGSMAGVVFAAIVGVPYDEENNVPTACEGLGKDLGGCAKMRPNVNGEGTMDEPDKVVRTTSTGVDQNYFEYACQRFEGDEAVTAAYPGMRYVDMAQRYANMGYVYSICHDDWSPAMKEIAGLIAENIGGTCYAKRLSWDPATETAGCNVVFDYYYDKEDYSSPPKCPDINDNGKQDEWEDDGEVTEDTKSFQNESAKYWVRSCTVKKLPAPINCDAMDADLRDDYLHKQFGWFYCENPGEDNSEACKDGLDNDRDGAIDGLDEDCAGCEAGTTCKKDCPYKVSLTDLALAAAATATTKNVVCLQQYRFEDPNCKENTFDSCNDGEDNDGNGPFDCWSYSKAEADAKKISPRHFPDLGARNADPDCCPMRVSDDGENRCEFLDARSNPVNGKYANASYVEACDVGTSASDIPDSCCEAATALLCQLPAEIKTVCDSRGSK